jgi:Xaa-Pro aminopeptidase
MKKAGMKALLCTGEFSRFFAVNFDSSAGMVLVLPNEAYFFTDFRYLEMAKKAVSGCEVCLVAGKRNYFTLINELLAEKGIHELSVEDKVLTVAEFEHYRKMIEAELLPAGDLLNRLRVSKEPWELERI